MEGDPFIPGNVIGYAHDDRFIVAAQKSGSDCLWRGEAAKWAEHANNTGNPLNFWIIDIDADRVYGPFSIAEYFQERQELNIPDDLKMDISI